MGLFDFMFGADPPPAPDYKGAAEQTAAGNFQNLVWQTNANRPTQKTPWGTTSWSYSNPNFNQADYDAKVAKWEADQKLYGGSDGVWSKGPPKPSPYDTSSPGSWEQTVSLDPRVQSALDSQLRVQQARSSGAESLIGAAQDSFSKPMDWEGLPALTSGVDGDVNFGGDVNAGDVNGGMSRTAGDWRQTAQDAITKLQQPDLDRRRQRVRTELANQGIPPGSEAYDAAMREVNDAESRANLMAIGEGRQESNMLFGQDLESSQFGNRAQQQRFSQLMAQAQRGDTNAMRELEAAMKAGAFNNDARQQAVSEAFQRRNQPLNEMSAFMTGQQVQSPQMPSFTNAGYTGGPNYTGAVSSQWDADSDLFNFNQAKTNSQGNAAVNAALYAFSDARLKRDIKFLFTLGNGIRVYQYRMLGKDTMEIGVLAQEVAEVMPEAVVADASGFLKVNYNRVLQ